MADQASSPQPQGGNGMSRFGAMFAQRLGKVSNLIKGDPDDEKGPIGKLLVDQQLISLAQLEKALEEQKTRALRLGQTVVAMGYAAEADVLNVINRHYQTTMSALDDPAHLPRAANFMARVRQLRISIKAKLSIAVIFILLLTILILSFVVLTRQRENLYQETVTTGKVSLGYFSNAARLPLLNDEVLRLNNLIKEASSTEGIIYAVIADRDGMVKAHSDASKINRKLEINRSAQQVTQERNFSYFRTMDEKGRQILDLSSPVMFQDKLLGSVHVGVSLDFISDQIAHETLIISMVSVLIIALGIVIAIFLGISFSRPITALVVGTREIGQGNLKFRIPSGSNDELGDLANSFNSMSEELWKKQLMQESFGKYVGSDIVQMILANPESTWLKGTRNTASVLFTDIRGFTAHSEQLEPEVVVEQLNQYFEIATRIIIKYGGYVDKFIGDAVMGVFGVPVAKGEHAEQCVRAAMEMQKEFSEAGKKGTNVILARVGIGINTGPLVAGNLGSQAKMEYTVIGDAVNTASRLNGLALSGETVISKATLDKVAHLVKVKEMEPQKVKGKAEPVQCYKVLEIIGDTSHVAGSQKSARPHA